MAFIYQGGFEDRHHARKLNLSFEERMRKGSDYPTAFL